MGINIQKYKYILFILFVFLFIEVGTSLAAKDVQTLIKEGDKLLQQFDYDGAKAEFEKAWKQTPSLESMLRTKIGVIYTQKNRWIEAAEEFERAAELDPKNVVIHFNLANVYASMDFLDKAIAEYEAILKIQPDLYWAEFNMSNLYYEQKN